MCMIVLALSNLNNPWGPKVQSLLLIWTCLGLKYTARYLKSGRKRKGRCSLSSSSKRDSRKNFKTRRKDSIMLWAKTWQVLLKSSYKACKTYQGKSITSRQSWSRTKNNLRMQKVPNNYLHQRSLMTWWPGSKSLFNSSNPRWLNSQERQILKFKKSRTWPRTSS